jgi:parallel beta-helix repeat protein
VRGLAINRFPENGVLVDQFDGALYGLQRVIADCYVGTDPTGRLAAPNALRGIAVVIDPKYGAGLNIFDNVISGNGRSGIYMSGGSGAHISNNRIGVTAGTGLAPLGNGASGVYLGSSSSIHVNQNVIAFNRDVGIGSDLSAGYIGLQRNVITANGTLAIDYGLDGVTFNDSANRPAELPQFPTITSARWDATAGVTRIEGIAPPSRYTGDRGAVDIYRNSSVDARGFGPAEEWLGQVILEASSDSRPFTLTVPRNVQGNFVAATFTRSVPILPWTSELGATVPVTP